jgi:UPF0755 protein
MRADTRLEHFGSQPRYDRDPSRRWPWVLLAVGATILVVAGSAVMWLEHQVNPPGKVGPEVRVTVAQGMSTAEIGQLLEREGVIANAGIFKLYLKLTGSSAGIEAGDYTLRRRSHLAAVVKTLEGGAAKEVEERLTIPEGLTLQEIANVVGALPGRSADRFMEVANSGTIRSQYEPAGVNSLEGLVLPETYFISPKDDEPKILRRLVDGFDATATQLDLAGAAARMKLTPYQAVVLASIVEREARVDEDRGKVARVVYNRLDKQMPLQIDATVLFGLGKVNGLTQKDREVTTPYNTYKIAGLPPGPIANPGRKSLEATVSPTPGNWIFYVLTDPSGKHSFTADPAEFGRLVAQCNAKGLCGD